MRGARSTKRTSIDLIVAEFPEAIGDMCRVRDDLRCERVARITRPDFDRRLDEASRALAFWADDGGGGREHDLRGPWGAPDLLAQVCEALRPQLALPPREARPGSPRRTEGVFLERPSDGATLVMPRSLAEFMTRLCVADREITRTRVAEAYADALGIVYYPHMRDTRRLAEGYYEYVTNCIYHELVRRNRHRDEHRPANEDR